MTNEEVYLRAILATVARQAFPPNELEKLVSPARRPGDKQIAAYNLCDGTRTQAEIAGELSLDSGAFSRTASRWVELGIAVRVGEKRESRLIHLYPLPADTTKKERANAARKGRNNSAETADADLAAGSVIGEGP